MIKNIFFFFLGVFVFFGGLVFLFNQSGLPTEADIKGCLTTKLYQVELCPSGKNYVPLNQISSYLKKTIVLTEDSSFYSHKGFDWASIEKNAKDGWKKGTFKRGGSTITQQLAKNMFLTKDRTFTRKFTEAFITDKIEHTLTKNEILERYLNVIEFGHNLYGVKPAAQFYFKKSPSDLDIVESAFLAMLLPNPIKYSKSFHRKELTPFAKQRLNQIVEDLFRYQRISEDEYQQALLKLSSFLQPEMPPNTSDTPIEENLDIPESEESIW